jgi:hypothetical protein
MNNKTKGTGNIMQTIKGIADGILKLALIAVLVLFVYFVIGIAIALGGSSKSARTQPASVTPAVAATTPVTAPAAPSTGNACHGVHMTEVENVACDEQITREGAEATAVLKRRQAEQNASNLEAIAQAQEEAES